MHFIPILEHLPSDLFKVKKLMSIWHLIDRFTAGQVEKREEEEECTNFIHAYLREIRKREASGNADTTVNGSLFYWNVYFCFRLFFSVNLHSENSRLGQFVKWQTKRCRI